MNKIVTIRLEYGSDYYVVIEREDEAAMTYPHASLESLNRLCRAVSNRINKMPGFDRPVLTLFPGGFEVEL